MKILIPATAMFGAALGATIQPNMPNAQAAQYQQTTPRLYQQPKYTTITTWEDCTTEPTVTRYSEVTKTTCPLCTKKPSTTAPKPPPTTKPKPPPVVHTTKYTTFYTAICSTGFTKTRYVVTETCTGPTPSWPTRHPSYMPPGFTKTVTVCTVCEGTTRVTATLTVPCTDKTTRPPMKPTKKPPYGGKPPQGGKPPKYPTGKGKPGPGCKSPPCRPTYRSSHVTMYPPPPTHYPGTKNAAVAARPTAGVDRGVGAVVVGGFVAALGAGVL